MDILMVPLPWSQCKGMIQARLETKMGGKIPERQIGIIYGFADVEQDDIVDSFVFDTVG